MLIIINLKAYDIDPQTIIDAISNTEIPQHVTVGIAAQPMDIPSLVTSDIPVFAQHIDPISAGSYTGSILPKHVARAGATGSLLNHSEKRLKLADIETAIDRAQKVGLSTVVCANTPAQSKAISVFGPDAIAIEPPELIGTGTPVSKADPDLIEDTVATVKTIDETIDVFCGAGISSGSDVKKAADLGAEGVLVASGVAKADNPTAALQELVSEI
ncbi:MAG: triose-phosphate isomerase [Halobacteriaceae archaeon]